MLEEGAVNRGVIKGTGDVQPVLRNKGSLSVVIIYEVGRYNQVTAKWGTYQSGIILGVKVDSEEFLFCGVSDHLKEKRSLI